MGGGIIKLSKIIQAPAKATGVPDRRRADTRYIEDYRRVYREAWEVAWSSLRWDASHRQPNKLVEWAHDIAHKVALDFAETERRWRSH